MRKFFILLLCLAFILTAGSVMADGAGQNKDGAGLYQHTVTGAVKFFKSHPGTPSQWIFIGGDGPCYSCTQTSDSTAIAAPGYAKSAGNQYGYVGVYSQGTAITHSYAEGTKSAYTRADATGTARGDFGSFVVDTPRLKFGAVGAYSKLDLSGRGKAVGVDYHAYGPDSAGVDITLSGEVVQETGGWVGNDLNGFGGSQYSGANFVAYDWDYSYSRDYGFCFWTVNNPALSVDYASANALAAGGTVGFNRETPNAAMGGALTANMAKWSADAPMSFGSVYGAGDARFVATKTNGLSGGQVSGVASFCYDNQSMFSGFGAGVAGVGGVTRITNTSNSSTVTSSSVGFSTATGGGRGFDLD